MQDLTYLLYFIEAVVIIGVFFFFYKRATQKLLAEIKELKSNLEETEKKCSALKEDSKVTQVSGNTSYITAEIQKREKLEDEIKRLKSSIATTKSLAKDASMVKSEFLANIRHEIRTPLNSILVFADLLTKNIMNAKLNSFAVNINKSGHKLLSLIDNIIELSSIESGDFELDESAIDTVGYFSSMVEPFKSSAYQKGLEYSLEIDEKIPESLILDPERVKEIVENLVHNAIKFTTLGYVKISIKVDGKNSASNTVDISISVEDSGIGIDEKNQDKIFEIFEKKDNCSAIEFEGTGLGLSINRKLASLMNGSLEVQSTLDQGSVFTLSLKGVEVVLYAKHNETDSSNVDFNLISPDGAKVLAVDNEKTCIEVIKESFASSAVKVVDFDNARSAIEFLQKEEVDLIFIDVEILSIDSGAVSQVISSLSQAPVVTLTKSRLKGINFGAGGVKPVGHLLKPILKTALFKIALTTLNSQGTSVQEIENKGNDEDNSLNRKNLEEFLTNYEENLDSLYKKAIKTNDLNAIRRFADATLEVSLVCGLKDISSFCEQLINKVDLFEIDSISDMLKLFESKIKRYKSFIKE